ncbi:MULTISPECIES: MFS transporter [unclassified Nocardioides]|uniref:MFS transporter n=1 Tax=unclassified Nocardioides TaxID=2615069 RepID=UPI0006F6E992|nr:MULTISPECIES: MFS transporter [unclassified Nocardioides]KQY51617.1 hypothetical protein ASD30_19815 [Nocardioides sp. Root140]KRF10981.1 hypothetical protein ASH02_19275 [Nocardioides sp. Soil796]
MRAAFRSPGFGWLFAGTTTSMLGDSIMLLVFSLWVKTLTDSNGLAGLTFLFMLLPTLIAPLLGATIDRMRRKPLLVWGNVASAVMLTPLLFVHDASHVWIIWSVAFLYGVSMVVLPAGLNGLLKELLPDELLVDANASLQTVKEGYRLFGPLVGAALFALTHGWGVVVVDMVSFLVAAVCIARIKLTEDLPEREDADFWSEMTAGARHLAHEPVLRQVVISFAILLLVLGYAEASIYAITDAFHKPAEYVGVLVSVQGLGAIVGGLCASRLVRSLGEPASIALGLFLMGTSFLGVSLAPTLTLLFAPIMLMGFTLPLTFVAFTTLVQRRTPQRLMGRVSTAIEVLLGTPQALSLIVGAALVTLLSYQVIWALMGALTLVAAAYLAAQLRRPSMREALAL